MDRGGSRQAEERLGQKGQEGLIIKVVGGDAELLTCESFEDEGGRLFLIVGRSLLHLTVHVGHADGRKGEWRGETGARTPRRGQSRA